MILQVPDSVRQGQVERRAMPVWQIRALNGGFLRSCINCQNFSQQHEECLLVVPPTRPPAYIIVLGCDSWEHEIPF